jgi:GTPase SAR1 family protein
VSRKEKKERKRKRKLSMQHRKCYRVGLAGQSGTGKTSFMARVVHDSFVEGAMLKEKADDFRKELLVWTDPTRPDPETDVTVMVEFYDMLGDEEEFQVLRDQWVRDCDAYLLFCDLSNESTALEVEKAVQHIVSVKDAVPKQIPMIMVGAKSDLLLPNCSGVIETAEGVAKKLDVPFKQVSAKTGSTEEIQGVVLQLIRIIQNIEINRTTQTKMMAFSSMKCNIN